MSNADLIRGLRKKYEFFRMMSSEPDHEHETMALLRAAADALEAVEAPVAEERVEYACDYPVYLEEGSPRRIRAERDGLEGAQSMKKYVDSRIAQYNDARSKTEPARVVKRTVTYGTWEEVTEFEVIHDDIRAVLEAVRTPVAKATKEPEYVNETAAKLAVSLEEPVYEYAIDGVQDRKAKVIMPRTVEDILAYAARFTNPPRKVYRRIIGEWEEVK